MDTLDEKTIAMINGIVNSGQNVQDILIRLSDMMQEVSNGK
nr:MAG TPA: hypothetical protein [Caudoviricetes sp.]